METVTQKMKEYVEKDKAKRALNKFLAQLGKQQTFVDGLHRVVGQTREVKPFERRTIYENKNGMCDQMREQRDETRNPEKQGGLITISSKIWDAITRNSRDKEYSHITIQREDRPCFYEVLFSGDPQEVSWSELQRYQIPGLELTASKDQPDRGNKPQTKAWILQNLPGAVVIGEGRTIENEWVPEYGELIILPL